MKRKSKFAHQKSNLDSFLNTKTESIVSPQQTNKENTIIVNKNSDIKKKRCDLEISLINKNVFTAFSDRSEMNNINDTNIMFPFIIITPLGINNNFNISNINSYFLNIKPNIEINNSKYFKIDSQIITDNDCIDVLYQNKTIGYISKDISMLLSKIINTQTLNTSFLFELNKKRIYIKIEINYKAYEIQIITNTPSNPFTYYISYGIHYNKIITSHLKKLYSKSSNINENKDLFCNTITLFDNLSHFENISDDEENENDNSNQQQLYTSFLISNASNIMNMVILNKDGLFNENDISIAQDFITKLNINDKSFLLKFITRTSKWISFPNEPTINESINNLLKLNFISEYSFTKKDYNSLFHYLHSLSVSELKQIETFILKITKNKQSTKNEILSKVNDVFINNSFHNINSFINKNENTINLMKSNVLISQYITSLILDKNFNSFQKTKDFTMTVFHNKFHKDIVTKEYNERYIQTNLNYCNFRKVHFYKNMIFNGKMKLITNIIENVDLFMKETSSLFMEKFLKAVNKGSNGKEDVMKEMIGIINKKRYCLDVNVGKVFDIGSRLFLFYGDYTDIMAMSKEFYGLDLFEPYDNYVQYILNSINNENNNNNINPYLQPIFTNKKDYEIYDALYQIKRAYNIMERFFEGNINHFDILYKILSFLFMDLLYYANCVLYNEIFSPNVSKIDGIDYETLFKQILLPKYKERSTKSVINLKDSFKLKYTYSHIASELLTYYADICEHEKKYTQANFIYLYLLVSNNLIKKRGHWLYRTLLNLDHHIKSKCLTVNIINSIHIDIPYIKSGYLLKLKSFYSKFISDKHSKKNRNNKHLQQLKENIFPINNNNNNNKKDSSPLFLSSIFKEIDKIDSIYNPSSGRRLYSINDSIVTVEQFALNYYFIKENYIGVHGENEILPTILNILLWDCIYFDKVPQVFQSPYQSYPLDFFYEEFYKEREDIINERLGHIEKFNEEDIEKEVGRIYKEKMNVKTVFINWNSHICNEGIVVNVIRAITPGKIAKVLKRMVGNIKYLVKGMPDLFMWKGSCEGSNGKGKGKAMWGSGKIVEVKSERDKLSDYQKYWLEILHECEIPIEVLHIK